MECSTYVGICQTSLQLGAPAGVRETRGAALRTRREELAEQSVEIFADEEALTVVIHCGRDQISIEVGMDSGEG